MKEKYAIGLLLLLVGLLLTGCTTPNYSEKTVTKSEPKVEVNTEQINQSDSEQIRQRYQVKLIKVIDGDTLKLQYVQKDGDIGLSNISDDKIGENVKKGEVFTVRLLNIDCPETVHPKLGEQPFGKACKQMTTDLVNNSTLEIEYDQGGDYQDKYGRELVNLYADNENVAERLIEEGLARVAYVFNPNSRHIDALRKAQNNAKERDSGIWSIDGYVTKYGFNSGN
ncbi:thermonuclease family protein [Viridibacillus arvi]|uniref:thermonuclease family protein n=1 Tax=Viridibacillus arvi TaxID=263475 RepID=UPI0034CDD1AC